MRNKKTITLIDFFWESEGNEDILIESIKNFKSRDHDILLSTGGKITAKMAQNVDYILYDANNDLFEREDYIYTQPWVLRTYNQFFLHTMKTFSTQRHGLPVLRRFFNALEFAKSLGYTNFQRIIFDVVPGEKCLDYMEQIELMCEKENKKGFFYFNDPNFFENFTTGISQNHPDLLGDYFFSNINFFLENVPKIQNETDYIEMILSNFGEPKFLTVEKFFYHYLHKSEFIIKKPGSEFQSDFSDRHNLVLTSSSISHLNFKKKFEGFPVHLTKVIGTGKFVLYSNNISKTKKTRKVLLFAENKLHSTIDVELLPSHWCIHDLDEKIDRIEVFQGDKFLYSEIKGECLDTIEYYQ